MRSSNAWNRCSAVTAASSRADAGSPPAQSSGRPARSMDVGEHGPQPGAVAHRRPWWSSAPSRSAMVSSADPGIGALPGPGHQRRDEGRGLDQGVPRPSASCAASASRPAWTGSSTRPARMASRVCPYAAVVTGASRSSALGLGDDRRRLDPSCPARVQREAVPDQSRDVVARSGRCRVAGSCRARGVPLQGVELRERLVRAVAVDQHLAAADVHGRAHQVVVGRLGRGGHLVEQLLGAGQVGRPRPAGTARPGARP